MCVSVCACVRYIEKFFDCKKTDTFPTNKQMIFEALKYMAAVENWPYFHLTCAVKLMFDFVIFNRIRTAIGNAQR